MFALNPHFALLAAQCMLSLVAFSSPAAAVAVHSDHRGFSDSRGRHSVLLAPRGKERHTSEERGSSSMHKASKKRKPRDAELVARRRSSETPNHHFTDATGEVGERQLRNQQFFQTREPPITGAIVGLIDPLLEIADGTIKGLVGADPLGSILVGRGRPHDHYYQGYHHDHDKVINHPSRIDTRSVLHTRRDQQGVPGNVDIMQGPNKIASLVLQPVDDGYQLNASKENSTTMYLLKLAPFAGPPLAVDPEGIHVQLQLPVFQPQSAALESYCATYDPNPTSSGPITAEPCSSPSQASAHKSQLFTYDAGSGSLQPISSVTGENGGTTSAANAGSGNTGENKLAGSGAVQMWARDFGDLVHDVALVFNPYAEAIEDYSSSETPSVTTVTVTETATQANPPPTGAGVGTSTSASTSDVPESTTLSSGSQSSPNTFNVEVALPSTTSSSASPEASINSVSSSSSEPSATADPDAVAASIASTDTPVATTSDASTQPTPASLLVQITRPANPRTSTRA